MRIDPLNFSNQTDSIDLDKQASLSLEDLTCHQEIYWQFFRSILCHPHADHTTDEIKLKELGQNLEIQANRSREAISFLYAQNPDRAQVLKKEYEDKIGELYSFASDLTQITIKDLQEGIEAKYKELSTYLPINPGDFLTLQILIQECRSLVVITRDQLQLINNLRILKLTI